MTVADYQSDIIYVKLMTDADNQPDIMSLASSWLMLITNQTLYLCQAHDWCW